MTEDNSGGTAPAEPTDDECSTCGEPIETEQWHPVATQVEDGSIVVYTFCSKSCRTEWEDDSNN